VSDTLGFIPLFVTLIIIISQQKFRKTNENIGFHSKNTVLFLKNMICPKKHDFSALTRKKQINAKETKNAIEQSRFVNDLNNSKSLVEI